MAAERWRPSFTITPAIARKLMEIEAIRAEAAHAPLPPAAASRLLHRARLRSTHYSTRIEGNRLTLEEARQVVEGRRVAFAGRERDVGEVRNYWRALTRVEEWAARGAPVTEVLIRRLHAMVEYGPRAKATPYRDGQNAIRDAQTGALFYLPPEARDVPPLMAQLMRWIADAAANMPLPLVAGLAHYQFVTIHPFYDGNGRTARLLATLLLQRGGYGLQGLVTLEEYHARELDAYYQALAAHPHYNYYLGRAEADLTGWVEYFTATVAVAFAGAREEIARYTSDAMPVEPPELLRLDHRARVVLWLFAGGMTITAAEVARELGVSARTARLLLASWVRDGWLQVASAANRNRAYRLSAIYRQYINQLSAMHTGENRGD